MNLHFVYFYCQELDVNFLLRKAATVSTPVCEIYEEDGGWMIKTSTTLKTMELKFKVSMIQIKSEISIKAKLLVTNSSYFEQLGEPFDETTPDGREVTAVCTLEDGKIISVQKAKKEGQKSTKVRQLIQNLDFT